MLGDVLVGSAPDYTGVVSSLLGIHGSAWYVTRHFVVSFLLLFSSLNHSPVFTVSALHILSTF